MDPTPAPAESLVSLLDQLRDIALPPPVPMTPATPAWAVLAALLLAALAAAAWAWTRHRRRTAYRRAALAELRALAPALVRGDPAALAPLDRLIRRTALAAFPAPRSRPSPVRPGSPSSTAPAAASLPSRPRSPPAPTPRARRPSTGRRCSPPPATGSPATMLELAFPWALAALPLPLLVLWLAPARRETVQAVRFPFFEGASAGLDKGEGAVVLPRGRLQMAFAWLLWALVLLTLARPEWVGPPVERSEAARDVMLAVDISGSMATKDFAAPGNPHAARLDGVKSVLDGFIAGRRDDRIGLIVFGSAPYVLVPFTRDTAAARALLATLAPGMAGQNTVLGDAIGLAIRSFEASKVEARVLILLSDGSDTASRMAPAKAADIAKQNGVVIHTIAVGDPAADDEENRVDEATLRAIATATGGSFHRATDADGLTAIYAGIDALGAREGATVSWRPRTPVAAIPAAAGAALVLLAYAGMLLATRLRRRRTRREAAA